MKNMFLIVWVVTMVLCIVTRWTQPLLFNISIIVNTLLGIIIVYLMEKDLGK